MPINKQRGINFVILLVSITFCILITELGMRILLKGRFVMEDERNLTYRYDSMLGWFPIENSKKKYKGTRTILIGHNSRGFRDNEHIIENKPGIIFLGDSFVWGYDVEQSERFTERLREKLPDWSVYNLGVSGYGTDQEYLLLKQQYDFYSPKIVFLVFCTDNDEQDNSSNRRYGGYYKPYFVINAGRLELRGIPVPKSGNYLINSYRLLRKSYWAGLLTKLYFRYVKSPPLEIDNPTQAIISEIDVYVKNKGAKFIVGLQEKHPELEAFLKKNDISCLNLENSKKYPGHGRHWTPVGHTLVCERIYSFLKNGDYL
jgi:hypothetical protein